jgi:hypothetical protein
MRDLLPIGNELSARLVFLCSSLSACVPGQRVLSLIELTQSIILVEVEIQHISQANDSSLLLSGLYEAKVFST